MQNNTSSILPFVKERRERLHVPNCFCKKETGINQKPVCFIPCEEREECGGEGILGRIPFLHNFDVLVAQSESKAIGGIPMECQWKQRDLFQISNRTKLKRKRNN